MKELINKLLSESYDLNQKIDIAINNISMNRLGNIKRELNKAQEKIIDLMKSLNYRKASINFHITKIIETTNEIIEHSNHEFQNRRIVNYQDINSAPNYLLFLLDDFIFNLLSFYDYLAKLVYLTYFKRIKRIDWNWLIIKAKKIRSRNNSNFYTKYRIRNEDINSLIEENYQFIRKISDIRSDLLHNRSYESNLTQNFNWTPESTHVETVIKFPSEYSLKIKIFQEFLNEQNITEADIAIGSSWIYHRFSKSISIILNIAIERVSLENKDILKLKLRFP